MALSERVQKLNANTAIPRERIRASVPQSLHPDQILDCAEACVDSPDATVSINGYSAGRSAMKLMLENLSDIDDAVSAATIVRPIPNQIVARGNKPQLERVVAPEFAAQVRGAMATSADHVARGVEKHLKAIESSIATVEQQVESKLKNPRVDSAEAADIRRYANGLPANERMGWVHSRIAEGDLTVSHAILNFSSWASGLEPARAELLREMARQRFAPTEVKMRDALRSVQTKVMTAAKTFASEYAKRLPAVPDGKLGAAIKNLQSRGAAS